MPPPYLFVNTGKTKLHGTLNQQVTVTIVGVRMVDDQLATVHASQDAQIHILDSLHDINPATENRLTDQESEQCNALLDRSRHSGIEVIDSVEEGQCVLEKVNSIAKMQAKRRALETASLGKIQGH